MKSKFVLIFLVVAGPLMLVACSKKNTPTGPIDTTGTKKNTDTVAIANYQSPLVNDTNRFYHGVTLGHLDNSSLADVSGIAASRYYLGMFWAHNDQGDPNNIYLIDSTGKIRAYFSVTNAPNFDWTDMAVGPGPDSGVVYIYLGDVGDSKENRLSVNVYRFPEPQLALGVGIASGKTASAEKISFKYPDGPRDAETLLFDPLTKDLFVISKDLGTNVYQVPYPQRTDTVVTAKEILMIPGIYSPRGGSISTNGQEMLLKDLTDIYYWKRNSGESIFQTLLRTPLLEPIVPEAKGEAICWSASGDAYYTTSKYANGIAQPFDCYRRK
jgi:hypothetical protein